MKNLMGRVTTGGVSVFNLEERSVIEQGKYFFDGCVGHYPTVDEAVKAHKTDNLVLENVMFDGFARFYKPIFGANMFGTEYLSYQEITK